MILVLQKNVSRLRYVKNHYAAIFATLGQLVGGWDQYPLF
jgi:hypothetical protein